MHDVPWSANNSLLISGLSPLHGDSAVKLRAHFCLVLRWWEGASALLTSSGSSWEQYQYYSVPNCRDNSRGQGMWLSPCPTLQWLAAWQGVAANPHCSLQQWALLGILPLFSWVGGLWSRRISVDLQSTTNGPAPTLFPSRYTLN